MSDRCLHCQTRKAARARGLCYRCYSIPAIRDLYPLPPGHKRGPKPGTAGFARCVSALARHRSDHAGDREPTEAELDALIAAQYPTMPGQREVSPPDPYTIPIFHRGQRGRWLRREKRKSLR